MDNDSSQKPISTLERLDPRNIKIKMSKKGALITMGLTLVGLVVLGFVIYYIFVMFVANKTLYPVLLTSPIRGAHFTHLPSMMEQTLFPVVDRQHTEYKGIVLPYRGNELSFVQEPRELPELNHQVQFTLSFWVKIENLPQMNQSCTSNYAKLFVQDRYTRSSNHENGLGRFAIMYDVANNNLVISVDYLKHSTTENTVQTQLFKVPNTMQLQKWQMITVVLENRDIDVYHNDQMVRSFHLHNVPYLVNNDWRLFPGKTPFVGTISCARYFNYAFNNHEVYRLHEWKRTDDVPYESYYLWWTWYQGNSLTALYRTIQNNIKG